MEVQITTKLAEAKTVFLHFNKGYAGGAGNVLDGSTLTHDVPQPGHLRAYLWEEVWERDRLLEILGRCLVWRKKTRRSNYSG